MSETYDPMNPVAGGGSGVPVGAHTGEFKKAEHLTQQEPDPMTGKGGRQYAGVKFLWEIVDGAHKGKVVSTETTTATGLASGQFKVWGWLTGKTPASGERVNLLECVGKKYLLTLGSKPGKTWVEVVNAMRLPNQ